LSCRFFMHGRLWRVSSLSACLCVCVCVLFGFMFVVFPLRSGFSCSFLGCCFLHFKGRRENNAERTWTRRDMHTRTHVHDRVD
jgi:hypothetical protein